MSKEMEFAVFCMESYKSHRNLKGRDVLKVFLENGVFAYLIECYDTLHTQSRECVTSDVLETLAIWERKKGVTG